MRILHTADWHLGKRLGRIDRAPDLQRSVAAVLSYCESERVDVLLIAGDLFDNIRRPDDLRDAIAHLRDTAGPFLRRGGTILAITGNHDRETYCATLEHTLALGHPAETRFGTTWPTGRFHLATRETFCRLPDRESGGEIQFVLLPYPAPTRHLDDAITAYGGGREEKNRTILESVRDRLARMRRHSAYRHDLHSVLVAHLMIRGASLSNGREIDESFEQGQVLGHAEDFDAGWAYVALGDLHKPQCLGGRPHMRYSGSIDRMNIDEAGDDKGCVLAEIGPGGLRGEPAWLPLDATPFLDVAIDDPEAHLPALEAAYPGGTTALARCRVAYTTGVHDPDEIRRRLDGIFPRCYDSDIRPARGATDDESPSTGPSFEGRDTRETVLDYVRDRLAREGHARADAVLAAAESLIEEVRP